MQEAHATPLEPLPAAFLADALALAKDCATKEEFTRRKLALASAHGIIGTPQDSVILMSLAPADAATVRERLRTHAVRTGSGVTVLAVMTKPMPCPHGKCTYCPGGPGSAFGDTPQSYTGHEPATMRGKRAHYDAYTQVFNRLEQYLVSGHNPEKVELILMGGTFPSYPQAYQDEVIAGVFQALDDFSAFFYRDETGTSEERFDLDAFRAFYELPGSVHDSTRVARIQERILRHKRTSPRAGKRIAELQAENETAAIRCVGLTIETRPTHALLPHALRMLAQGCTRVELGVQTTVDAVLTAVHRDHTSVETKASIAALRDLGFKLNFHLMLGLPGMTQERDLAAVREIFDDPAYRPDMIKIYPCMVMPGTPLFYEHQAGTYRPYTTAQSAAVIAQAKAFLPRWVRVMRVQRDIPTHVTTAGVDRTNLRQEVNAECERRGIACGCIRCREPRERAPSDATPVLRTTAYDAAGGEERFIEAVDPTTDTLLGFCRLRFPARTDLHPAITDGTALIRELHVYGTATGIGDEGEVQHRGLGSALMREAETQARAAGKGKMIIIAGVGVREYYIRRLGYRHDHEYVSKNIREATV